MKLKIDDIEYVLSNKDTNLTIFQFCFNKGINIPCFCYHEKLSIAGIAACVLFKSIQI